MASHPSQAQAIVSPDRIAELRDYVGFGPGDENNLAQVRRLIVPHLDTIIATFYGHISRFENLRSFLEDTQTEQRLHQSLHSYILTLGKDTSEAGYVEQRLRIGRAHERIGLSLTWYLGMYPLLFECIANALAASADLDRRLPELLISLQKAITLDSVLTVEAYHDASIQRLAEVVEEQKESQARLYREVRIDGLTQVFNKQAVMTALEAELLQCQRRQLPFTVLILDVDRFKRINDQHGHPFGDFVLRHVVDIVRAVMRPGDLVGRFGGDEIMAGLAGCSLKEGTKIADRVRLQVALAPFLHRGQSARVTLSIGVASLSVRASTLESIIDEADHALYRAKQAGRNRTRCAKDPPSNVDAPNRASALLPLVMERCQIVDRSGNSGPSGD